MDCQGVVTRDGGQAKLQTRYAKRRKLERNREDQGERKPTGRKDDAHIRAEEESGKKAVDKAMKWMQTCIAS